MSATIRPVNINKLFPNVVPMHCLLSASMKGSLQGKPFAVGAFNVNNMEQMQAIVGAAQKTNSPVIIQVSRGALKYADKLYLRNIVMAAAELNPDVQMALHLDHGDSLETVKQVIDLGFTSVMLDGSLKKDPTDPDGKREIPTTFAENVAITREAVVYAHDHRVTVEAELGALGGLEDGHGTGKAAEEEHLTKPELVQEFMTQTGADALAIAIGTSHGAFKSPKGLPLKLRMDIAEEIRRLNPDLPIVLHGASSVLEELVSAINLNGGQVLQAVGVGLDFLQKGIALGLFQKVNVDTDIRLAGTAGVRQFLFANPGKYDPREYLKPSRELMMKTIADRMIAFGSAGKMDEVLPFSLEQMHRFYIGKSLILADEEGQTGC